MIRRIVGGAIVIVVAWGVITWLAVPGNGRQLGNTGGDAAETGVSAIQGAGDGLSAFFRKLAN
jgi:hypothetical protein